MKNSISASTPITDRTFLIFRLGGKSYGIPFLRVAEVCTLPSAMPVLTAPDYDRGFVVLHGRTVPVLDLRARVGEPTALTRDTRLVVAWVRVAGAPDRSLGLLVDEVQAMETLAADALRERPAFGRQGESDFILGTAEGPDGRRVLCDVDRLCS